MCLPTIIILRKDIIILFVDMLFLHIDIIYLLLGINIYRKTSHECNAKIVLRSYTNATRVYLYDAFHFALLCRLPDSKQSQELLATSHYWSAGIGFNEQLAPLNHVEPTLTQRRYLKQNGWHMQGLISGLRALDQHRTNRWKIKSFVNVGPTKLPTKCQRLPNE